jgi:hypothetical protein
MLTFPNVWISSIEHLERFRELPWYKVLGLVPVGFPRVRIGFQNYPVVYLSRGLLEVDGELCFRAVVEAPRLMRSYSNLEDDLQFRLTRSDIVGIEPYKMTQAILSHFNLPFLRIRSNVGTLQDFLICAGGTNMSVIRVESQRLEVALMAFARAIGS